MLRDAFLFSFAYKSKHMCELAASTPDFIMPAWSRKILWNVHCSKKNNNKKNPTKTSKKPENTGRKQLETRKRTIGLPWYTFLGLFPIFQHATWSLCVTAVCTFHLFVWLLE